MVRIRIFTKPALLCLSGTVMGEVVTHDIFQGASIPVFGWHGYESGGYKTFQVASITVADRFPARSGPMKYFME